MMTIIFIALTILGLVISLYFTMVYLDMTNPTMDMLAKACNIDSKICERVIETPISHQFGVANFILGIFYYGSLLLFALSPFGWADFFYPIFLMLSWAVVIFSLYLAMQLIYILKIPCKLCFLSHGINLGIAILLSLY